MLRIEYIIECELRISSDNMTTIQSPVVNQYNDTHSTSQQSIITHTHTHTRAHTQQHTIELKSE